MNLQDIGRDLGLESDVLHHLLRDKDGCIRGQQSCDARSPTPAKSGRTLGPAGPPHGGVRREVGLADRGGGVEVRPIVRIVKR